MATPRAQIPDKASEVKAAAAAANSVPELRDQVVKLAEEVQRLQAKIAKLERRRS